MDAAIAQTPANFGPKSCFWYKLLPVAKLRKKFFSMCSYDDGNSCVFPAKKTNISNAKFGDLRANGYGVKICRKCHIWNRHS